MPGPLFPCQKGYHCLLNRRVGELQNPSGYLGEKINKFLAPLPGFKPWIKGYILSLNIIYLFRFINQDLSNQQHSPQKWLPSESEA